MRGAVALAVLMLGACTQPAEPAPGRPPRAGALPPPAAETQRPATRPGAPAPTFAQAAGPALGALLQRRAGDLREAPTLRAVYGGRPVLRFVVERGLSPAGTRLMQALSAVEEHGLEPAAYHRSELSALAAELRATRVPPRSLLLSLEILLADALLGLARDLSRGNTRPQELLDLATASSSRPVASSKPAASAPAVPEKLIAARLRRDLESVRDRATLETLLASLPPRHPQYRLLQGALRRYRDLSDRGGWQTVTKAARLPRAGRRHPLVLRLKQRLAAEGWLREPVDDRVDAALTRALRDYQRAHQLPQTGRVDRWLFASLNVSARDRLQAIKLTLQRWRESAVGELPYYALVNIPDFHLEVWKAGKLAMRQRVVVGKSSPEKCDEETERKVLALATPLQGAWLKTMVFSPYWNVTKTIRETELEPERGKDPEFYEKNGYELMQVGTAGEWVRQLPGPQNPLGFIKFLFPNPHETYLHDTPEKGLFDRPVRAFSHGCMRVEDAWRLAQLLLGADGQWDEPRFSRLLREWKSLDVERLRKDFTQELYEAWCKKAATLETTIGLRRAVPIVVEYYTVRVDHETGEAQFLADIYQLDRMRLQPRSERRCIPESRLAKRRFTGLTARVEELEQRGRELAPKLAVAQQLAAPLEGSKEWEVRRLLKRVKKLDGFGVQVRNIAARIREQHEQLAGKLGPRERSWSKRQIEQVVRLERLVSGLEKLLREGAEVSGAMERLSRKGKQ